jgi:hypothetical protein
VVVVGERKRAKRQKKVEKKIGLLQGNHLREEPRYRRRRIFFASREQDRKEVL